MGITVNNNQSTIHHQHFHNTEADASATQLQAQLKARLHELEIAVAAHNQQHGSLDRELRKHMTELKQEIANKPKPDATIVERSLAGLGSVGTLVSAVQPLRDLLAKLF